METKYCFGPFVLDPSTGELSESGETLRIEPKAFDLLLYLLENRTRTLSKDDLVEAVWDGRFVSDAAVSTTISAARKALGDDGKTQRFIKTVHGRGIRFVHPVVEQSGRDSRAESGSDGPPEQDIRFCHSADGTMIAYGTAGEGPPLVKASNWLNHLEFDWESPVWRHFFRALASDHRLVRYDARGNGLSSWAVEDFSLDRQVEDLEAVVDAVGLERFPLIAISQGCLKAIAYAARHPERVTRMILIGGYSKGWRVRDDPQGVALREAAVELMRIGWGSDNPAVRQLFTMLYMPDAPAESQRWFSELQRKTASPENAVNIMQFGAYDDVADVLGAVKTPTLVIHARNDSGVPFREGQALAAGIPGARFAVLESANHIVPQTDLAWPRLSRLISDFLAEDA